jgi:nucleotide-binding universal stress UspA family protein
VVWWWTEEGTMWNQHVNLPVVVGVDGSEHSLRALDWAADEAAGHGWPLRLVHVEPSITATSTEHARPMFNAGLDRVATRGHADVHVTTALREGRVPEILLDETRHGRELVVGREGVGRLAGMVLGSTSLACATHADVPVVVVPEAWQPSGLEAPPVVVGVDGSPQCQGAIEYAFTKASDRGAPLVAVYAWGLPLPMPEGGPATGNPQAFEAQAGQILAESLGVWRDKYPGVDVTEVPEVGHPAAVLRQHAVNADLVVIGGRGHGTVTGMLLGSVARAVLRHVDHPIAVIHEPRGPRP